MKKVFLTLAAGALFSTLSFAETTPKSTSVEMTAYKVSDAHAVRVIVESPEENVIVLIKDQEGNVIYRDVIRNHASFSRKYIFSPEAETANYTIEVQSSQGSVNQSVTL